MRTLLSISMLITVSVFLIPVTGCSNSSKVTPTEIKYFKGGGVMSAQAQEQMKEHEEAFAKTHPRSGAPASLLPNKDAPNQ